MRDLYRALILALVLVAPVVADDEPCVVVEGVRSTDDNYEFWIAPAAQTVTAVGCHCEGDCSSPIATFAFEDRSGNALTLGSTLACSTGGSDTTFVNVTAGGALNAGEGLRFDVTNTPATFDKVTICAKVTP